MFACTVILPPRKLVPAAVFYHEYYIMSSGHKENPWPLGSNILVIYLVMNHTCGRGERHDMGGVSGD